MGVEHGIKLGVMKFSTEDDYDYLTVNGNGYSGGEAEVVGGIESLVATGTITWSSDCSVEGEGWKICHGVEPVEEVSCGTVFDDLELTEGEEMHVTCPDGCAHHDHQAVWGSNHYTSDSNVCKSAAHFGKDGMAIQVKALGMKSEFEESTRNGISTEGWADKWNAVFIS